jgi:hypothetical protein
MIAICVGQIRFRTVRSELYMMILPDQITSLKIWEWLLEAVMIFSNEGILAKQLL